MGDGIESQVAEEAGEKDRDFSPGNDLGQRHAGEDMDGREQESAPGLGEGTDEGTDAVGIDLAAAFERGSDDKARGLGQKIRDIF